MSDVTATRVIIIEGHQVLREGLALVLDRSGCVVLGTAETAAEGYELVSREQPDVVVVDLALADGPGTGLVRRLLAERKGLRVLLYAGAEAPSDLASALACGAHGIISKTATPEQFRTALRTVAAGDSYLDEELRGVVRPPAEDARTRLSRREREIVALLANGLSLEQIAQMLVLSPETVRTHVRNAGRRLGGRTRAHTVALAYQRGEIET